jgi:hypothetical protein
MDEEDVQDKEGEGNVSKQLRAVVLAALLVAVMALGGVVTAQSPDSAGVYRAAYTWVSTATPHAITSAPVAGRTITMRQLAIGSDTQCWVTVTTTTTGAPLAILPIQAYGTIQLTDLRAEATGSAISVNSNVTATLGAVSNWTVR